MTPWKHAESSAAKWGGTPMEYIRIHEWFDSTKQYTGDWTHRALRHHAAGIQWCIEEFGDAITTEAGKMIPVKLIGEQHVLEDCGFIPTVQDWLKPLAGKPEKWMLSVKVKSSSTLEIGE
jgi:hypothetical protein